MTEEAFSAETTAGMTALDGFQYAGHQLRTVSIDGEPWFILNDVCKVLGIANPHNVAARIDSDALRQTEVIDSMGRTQNTNAVDESGLYEVIIRSDSTQAVGFRRWITRDVLPSIRKTGSYGTPATTSRRDLALAVLAAEDEADRQRSRAEVAEQFKSAIELNDGLTIRDFHKKYFSEHKESEVNEFFYNRGLLLDERGKRWDENTGKKKDGKNHRRPTFQGKPFFYLHSELDRDKIRREHTRVRPGEPELALVEYMTKRGFTANQSELKGIAA